MKRPTRADTAGAALLAGLVAGPVGAFLQWGIGAALMVACILLVAVAILLGWDAG